MKGMLKGIALLLLLIAGVFGLQVWRYFHVDVLELTPPKFDFRAARESYPFSVIPGGVYDWQELSDSIQRDPVAREHYQGINPNRMWAERVRQPMAAYVSYRKGELVYWTDHPVNIAQGEIVLTDGKVVVRARCGNRVEVKKPTPLPGRVPPPDVPPPDVVFEVPLPALIPPTVVSPPTTTARVVENRNEKTFPRPPTWCCAPGQPPASVPEPGTLFLVGTGILGLGKIVKRRFR